MIEKQTGSQRVRGTAFVASIALFCGLLAGASAQDKLSKSDKKWVEEDVAAIITNQEIETFTALNKDDRKLFKEIFWMRRDYNPMTSDNEFQKDFEARVKAADTNFKNFARGRKGHATEPGQVFLLLGPPTSQEGGRQTNMVWKYDPNPDMGFPDGLELTFRPTNLGPRLADDDGLKERIDRIKMRTVGNPSVTYARGPNGRLQKTSGKFDPNSPAKKMLAELKESQTTTDAIKMSMTPSFFKAAGTDIYVAMDLRVTDGLSNSDGIIFGLVESADGIPIYQFEEGFKVTEAGYEMPIQVAPGSYKLYLGVHDKGATTSGTQILDLEVPDYAGGEFGLSSVLMFDSAEQVGDTASGPGKAFLLGGYHFKPKSELVYSKKDSLAGVFNVYNFAMDGEQPKLTLQCRFFRGALARGQTKDEPFMLQAKEMALTIFDIPVNLKNFDEPGDYRVELHITDHVSGKKLKEEIEFVVQ